MDHMLPTKAQRYKLFFVRLNEKITEFNKTNETIIINFW